MWTQRKGNSVGTPEFVRYKLKPSDSERRTVCILCLLFFPGEVRNTGLAAGQRLSMRWTRNMGGVKEKGLK